MILIGIIVNNGYYNNMNEIRSNEVYTTVEAQKLLKISKSTMKRFLKNGLIKASKIGKQYRILGHELLRLLSPTVDRRATNLFQKVKNRAKKVTKDW